MPGRTFTPTYRYNYQGQENAVNSKWQAFELRLHNSDLGRWMSPDPYGQFYSPYISMGNNPINGIDPDGGYWLGGQPGNSGGGQSYYQTPMEMHTNADAWYQSELENLYLLRHNGYIMAGYEFDCALANLNSTLDAMHASIAMIGWSGSDGGPNYWTANGNSNSGANDAFGTPFSDVDAPRSKMEAIGSAKLQEAMNRIYYDTYDVTFYANEADYLAGKNGTYLGNRTSVDDAMGLGAEFANSDPCPACKFLIAVDNIFGKKQTWIAQHKNIKINKYNTKVALDKSPTNYVGKYGGNTSTTLPITYTANHDFTLRGNSNNESPFTVTVTHLDGTTQIINSGGNEIGQTVFYRGVKGESVSISFPNATGYWNVNAIERWWTKDIFKFRWFPKKTGPY